MKPYYQDDWLTVHLGAPVDGLVICPLCKDPEREDDMVMGVCLTCAVAVADTILRNLEGGK